MAFFEDPRLRRRWNQIAHDAETVTENAAAGVFNLQQNYINPCLSSIAHSIEQCTAVCLGDPEERLRRRRERQRARDHAEFDFDFYDDWYQEEQGGGGGILGSWGGEDWDRLLAGAGGARKHGGETTEQPRRKRGMSYGTRGTRRKASTADDPTIIPSTQPLGFLSKLPWKMGGTLRYKPSAADLQDHPVKHDAGEAAPLLAPDDASAHGQVLRMPPRQRSGTTASAGTSDSYRSRGDLFPSDGEGEEDAIPLADDVTYDMIKKDDRSSGKTKRSSSSGKGKRPAGGFSGSRTVSRSTLASTTTSADSPDRERPHYPLAPAPGAAETPSVDDLRAEEERLQREQDGELARRKEAAQQLACERGLVAARPQVQAHEISHLESDVLVEADEPPPRHPAANGREEKGAQQPPGRVPGRSDQDAFMRFAAAEPTAPEAVGRNGDQKAAATRKATATPTTPAFQAARLPRFGRPSALFAQTAVIILVQFQQRFSFEIGCWFWPSTLFSRLDFFFFASPWRLHLVFSALHWHFPHHQILAENQQHSVSSTQVAVDCSFPACHWPSQRHLSYKIEDARRGSDRRNVSLL